MNMASKSKQSATVKGGKGAKGKGKASKQPTSKPEAPAAKAAKVSGKKPQKAAPVAPAAKAGKGSKALKAHVTQTAGEGGTFRYAIFGLPVTSILRWYGSQGAHISARAVHAALTAAGLTNLSPTTCGIQVAAGRHGEENNRGPVPELTKEQGKLLLAALEG